MIHGICLGFVVGFIAAVAIDHMVTLLYQPALPAPNHNNLSQKYIATDTTAVWLKDGGP